VHRVRVPPRIRDIIRRLLEDGWYLDRVRGSHRQFKHPAKPGVVTVAGNEGDEVRVGTLKSILKQARLEP